MIKLNRRKKCECGCGNIAKDGRRFIKHHIFRIWQPSPEQREKGRIALIGKGHSKEWCAKMSKIISGRKIPPEKLVKKLETWKAMRFTEKWNNWRKKLSIAHKGKILSVEHRMRLSESHKGYKYTPEKLAKLRAVLGSPETRLRMSLAHIGKKIPDEQRKKMMMNAQIKPNKSETKLGDLLNKLYPNEWKFVGDGQLIIGNKCPDFVNINGQKKIIELFGNYWHKGEDPKDRIKVFKPFGYKTLVIWESELRDVPVLKRRLGMFVNH